MSKCCYIHFKPRLQNQSEPNLELKIDNFPIKKISQAKFLGVTIDEKLSWDAHTSNLKKKLNHATATLNRIKDSLPTYLHKDLYHTLFESHLSYCISVWGGAAQCRTLPIWKAQKHCIRIMFGDKEAYLEKFRTCARARPFGLQALDKSFFEKEHSKPLFKNMTSCLFTISTHTTLSWKYSKYLNSAVQWLFTVSIICPNVNPPHFYLTSHQITSSTSHQSYGIHLPQNSRYLTTQPKLAMFETLSNGY